jgi:hypothetical protein
MISDTSPLLTLFPHPVVSARFSGKLSVMYYADDIGLLTTGYQVIQQPFAYSFTNLTVETLEMDSICC